MDWIGVLWLIEAWRGRRGTAGLVKASYGRSRRGRHGMLWRVMASPSVSSPAKAWLGRRRRESELGEKSPGSASLPARHRLHVVIQAKVSSAVWRTFTPRQSANLLQMPRTAARLVENCFAAARCLIEIIDSVVVCDRGADIRNCHWFTFRYDGHVACAPFRGWSFLRTGDFRRDGMLRPVKLGCAHDAMPTTGNAIPGYYVASTLHTGSDKLQATAFIPQSS